MHLPKLPCRRLEKVIHLVADRSSRLRTCVRDDMEMLLEVFLLEDLCETESQKIISDIGN